MMSSYSGGGDDDDHSDGRSDDDGDGSRGGTTLPQSSNVRPDGLTGGGGAMRISRPARFEWRQDDRRQGSQ